MCTQALCSVEFTLAQRWDLTLNYPNFIMQGVSISFRLRSTIRGYIGAIKISTSSVKEPSAIRPLWELYGNLGESMAGRRPESCTTTDIFRLHGLGGHYSPRRRLKRKSWTGAPPTRFPKWSIVFGCLSCFSRRVGRVALERNRELRRERESSRRELGIDGYVKQSNYLLSFQMSRARFPRGVSRILGTFRAKYVICSIRSLISIARARNLSI